MKDPTAIRERYLRDTLPTRLGGLAANLGRIRSFAAHGASDAVVESLIEESKHFIEWTTGDADIDTAAELVELQIELAAWQLIWPRTRNWAALRERLVERAGFWAERVLVMSGVLG